MNKETADKIIAAAHQVVGERGDLLLSYSYDGTGAMWVVFISEPQRTGHNGWLSMWHGYTLDDLLVTVQTYHARQVELHAAQPQQLSNWMTEFTNRMGRG